MNCTIHVVKTKTIISFEVSAKLICVFVFAYADCWFSHEAAHFFQSFGQSVSQSISFTFCSVSFRHRNISSKQWLWKHGLIAKKLTLLDALAPTFVPHKAKYVPILDKHVLSKVFDEV